MSCAGQSTTGAFRESSFSTQQSVRRQESSRRESLPAKFNELKKAAFISAYQLSLGVLLFAQRLNY
jgi:hypothetical protein